jgi:seryl-tRNA synthetase
MVDIKFIRENPEGFKAAVINKNIDLDIDRLLELDKKRVELLRKVEQLNSEKNKINEQIKVAENKQEVIEKGKQTKEQLAEVEPQYNQVKEELESLMAKVPTIPSPDTPVGKSDEDNVEVKKWGEAPKFDFEPKDYMTLAKELDIVDVERGAKVAGYRGYYIKNEGAILVMAMMMYALRKMVDKGYKPMITPTLIKEFALFGSGYFKGSTYNPETDEIYQVASRDKEQSGEESKDKKFLIGTAEPALLAYFANEILKEEDLPIRVCGFSQCYRSEIGSYGKDTKGIYRVHEFMKVEQVVLCKADIEESNRLQEEMVEISEEIHKDLGLHYRIIQINTGDMAAGKYRAFDIESWMPVTNRWAETGSASNFVDWQSRRLNVRYTDKNGERKYVYMLNDTALPSVRPFIAIIENFQQADGSVKIPEVLVPYTGFAEIKPK